MSTKQVITHDVGTTSDDELAANFDRADTRAVKVEISEDCLHVQLQPTPGELDVDQWQNLWAFRKNGEWEITVGSNSRSIDIHVNDDGSIWFEVNP